MVTLSSCHRCLLFEKTRPKRFPSGLCIPLILLIYTLGVVIFLERKGRKRNSRRKRKKSMAFGRFLSRYLLCSIASLRNFVLPDSIQTSGCIISPLPLWVTRPFSLPLLSMGSQPPRHRVLSQRFSLEHPFWTRHLPSYALLPPPHLSYFWGIPQRSMLIMANYRLNAFN